MKAPLFLFFFVLLASPFFSKLSAQSGEKSGGTHELLFGAGGHNLRSDAYNISIDWQHTLKTTKRGGIGYHIGLRYARDVSYLPFEYFSSDYFFLDRDGVFSGFDEDVINHAYSIPHLAINLLILNAGAYYSMRELFTSKRFLYSQKMGQSRVDLSFNLGLSFRYGFLSKLKKNMRSLRLNPDHYTVNAKPRPRNLNLNGYVGMTAKIFIIPQMFLFGKVQIEGTSVKSTSSFTARNVIFKGVDGIISKSKSEEFEERGKYIFVNPYFEGGVGFNF